MEKETLSKTEITPLPPAGISETLGLLEVIDDHGGKGKAYSLAYQLNIDTDVLLTTLKAAQLLGFVDTPGKDVLLTSLGKKMIETEMNTKKQLLLQQLRKIALFERIKALLDKKDDHRMGKNEVLEELQTLLPNEKASDQFETLINWGRWGEFLGYSTDDDYVYLDQG